MGPKPSLLYVVVGMDCAELTVRMVIAGLCKVPYPTVHLVTMPFTGIAVASHLAPAVCSPCCLQALLAWQTGCLLWLSADTISKICKRLDIPFLAPMTRPPAVGKRCN